MGFLLFAIALAGARMPPKKDLQKSAWNRPVSLVAEIQTLDQRAGQAISGSLGKLRTTTGRVLTEASHRLFFHSSRSTWVPAIGTEVLVAGMLRQTPFGSRLEGAILCKWETAETESTWRIRVWWQQIRNAIRTRFESTLSPAEAGLAAALVLGDRSAVETERFDAYRRLGLLHLLAISGMHLWLWDELFRKLLPRCGHGTRLGFLSVMVFLAQAQPAVMRAWWAICLRDFFHYRGLRISSWNLWATALWLELLLFPGRGFSFGLLLSYSATAALISVPSQSSRWRKILFPSAAAFCATAPWLHHAQGTLEPWSILFSPLLALSLPIRLSGAMLSLLPGIGDWVAGGLSALGSLEEVLLRAGTRLPASPWALPHIPSWLIGLWAGCLLLFLWKPQAIRRLLVALGVSAPLLVSPRAPHPGLAVLPVDHGLVAIISGQKHSLLFDLGSSDLSPHRLVDKLLLPELAKLRWPLPDKIVLSHADSDHCNAVGFFQSRYSLKELHCKAGETRTYDQFAPWKIRLIGCVAPAPNQRNAGGHVLDLQLGEFRALLLGDQFGYSLSELRKRLPNERYDLLLVPHHGLTTLGLGELLNHIQPKRAWASCGPKDLPLEVAPLLEQYRIPLKASLQKPLFWSTREAITIQSKN